MLLNQLHLILAASEKMLEYVFIFAGWSSCETILRTVVLEKSVRCTVFCLSDLLQLNEWALKGCP